MRFEEVEHTADRALRIRGRNLEDLFANSIEKRIELEAADAEDLLVAWLSELAFWAETESLIFNRFHFTELSPTRLGAAVRGGPVKTLQKHVKAVTFHNLAIRREPEGLVVTVVFDV
jgi:SHS2 domain-containing protein